MGDAAEAHPAQVLFVVDPIVEVCERQSDEAAEQHDDEHGASAHAPASSPGRTLWLVGRVNNEDLRGASAGLHLGDDAGLKQPPLDLLVAVPHLGHVAVEAPPLGLEVHDPVARLLGLRVGAAALAQLLAALRGGLEA